MIEVPLEGTRLTHNGQPASTLSAGVPRSYEKAPFFSSETVPFVSYERGTPVLIDGAGQGRVLTTAGTLDDHP